MDIKKSREADLEQKRTQGFLLGLIVVLATLFVLLEWNSGDTGWALFDDDDSLEAEVELSPLKRDKDEVPMMMPQEKKVEKQESEQLHLVDNDVELPPNPSCRTRPNKKNPPRRLPKRSLKWWICTTNPSTSAWLKTCRSSLVVPSSL